jgi:hypothetical protein
MNESKLISSQHQASLLLHIRAGDTLPVPFTKPCTSMCRKIASVICISSAAVVPFNSIVAMNHVCCLIYRHSATPQTISFGMSYCKWQKRSYSPDASVKSQHAAWEKIKILSGGAIELASSNAALQGRLWETCVLWVDIRSYDFLNRAYSRIMRGVWRVWELNLRPNARKAGSPTAVPSRSGWLFVRLLRSTSSFVQHSFSFLMCQPCHYSSHDEF